jgi:ribonuclease HII
MDRYNVWIEKKDFMSTTTMLSTSFTDDATLEIGVDEAGRGPLLGRVYAAAVVLPKDESFRHADMKDSKRFHSKKKIRQVARYIREHPGVKFAVEFVEPDVIDAINIRQAVFRAMHCAIRNVRLQTASTTSSPPTVLLIDGNDFQPYMYLDDQSTWKTVPHVTIEQGDNQYTCIAAASILAKVAHDDYIAELCAEHPELMERYCLDKNVGYGTRQHLEGIVKYGVTRWHRKSFARCKDQPESCAEQPETRCDDP